MKKLILMSLLILGTMPAYAEGIKCSKSILGTTYNARVTFFGASTLVAISASDNRATRNGRQSEGPVAIQLFTAISVQPINNVNVIVMGLPTPDPQTGVIELNYAKINQSGTKHTLLVKGRALSLFNRMKFQDCKTIL